MKYLLNIIDNGLASSSNLWTSTSGTGSRTPERERERLRHRQYELKQLLAEAKEGTDEKSSTQEFYETLERIVNELRNCSEHSQAFLSKVRKADAPDYYDVIKKPMDLGTALRKVKGQQYKNKQQFADDLNLIWSNCLIYNSHPEHPLRHSAIFLRQKTAQLLEFLTDKSASSQLHGAGRAPHSHRTAGRAFTSSVFGGQTSYYLTGQTPRAPSEVLDDHEQSAAEAEGHGGGDEMDVDADPYDDRTGDNRKGRTSRKGLPAMMAEKRNMSQAGGGPGVAGFGAGINGIKAQDDDRRSLSPVRARKDTRRRMSTISQATRPKPEHLHLLIPFEDRPAILRTPGEMERFLKLERTSSSSPSDPTSKAGPSSLSNGIHPISEKPKTSVKGKEKMVYGELQGEEEVDDDQYWKTVTSESMLGNAIPNTGFVDGEPVEDDDGVGLDEGQIPEHGKLSQKMSENINTIRQLRRLHHKVVNLASTTANQNSNSGMPGVPGFPPGIDGFGGGVRPAFPPPLPFDESSSDDDDEEDADEETVAAGGKNLRQTVNGEAESSTINGVRVEMGNRKKGKSKRLKEVVDVPKEAFASRIASQAGLESLRFISGKMAAHAGFDGASRVAVEVLTNIAAEYIMNLGRTARFYCDKYSTKMPAEDILSHVLTENGVLSPTMLESHIKDDIDRYGSRLHELKGKLEKTHRDMLDGVEKAAIGDEDLFAKDGEMLMTGDFTGELGEDFFGLRDLGLDKELGMSSLSIPTRLFHGEAKRSALGLQANSTEDPKLRFKPPPPFVDLSPSSLPAQIGLLRPFYQARLQTDHRLVDDEQSTLKVKVFRPKVPPSGKIPIKRKAGADDVANAGGSGASLKKKVKVEPGGNGASPAKASNGNGTIPKSESGNKGESMGDVDQSADFATVTVTGAEVENS